MKRREFITLLGGAATWPSVVWTQSAERVRRIGVLVNLPANDVVTRARMEAFQKALQELGWSEGSNLRIEYRWTVGGDDELLQRAQELVTLSPEVIMGAGSPTVVALRKATRTIPIVFTLVADPVGAGFVESLARPGGNATGFTPFEYTIGAKWLELLRAIAPNVTRAAVLREATNPGAMGQFVAVQSAASIFGMDLRPIDGGSGGEEIQRAVAAFAREQNGGLIVTATPMANIHRDLIIGLAEQHRLPAVYGFRFHVERGGLIAYAPDQLEQYRRAAGYVDRILKGEKPADLPVQAPTKYELVINMKTARALGLEVPPQQYDRLPSLATDLAGRAAVIAAQDTPSAITAKAATTTVPIVFASGGDPVKLGLVASLNRPGGNVTGVTFLLATLAAKQLGLLHELLPDAERIAVLVDPKFSATTEPFITDVRTAASAISKKIEVLYASSSSDLDAVFTGLGKTRADALLIGPGPFFNNRRVQLVTLATYHRVLAIYPLREAAQAGGLMSYGLNLTDAYRQVGIYAGRILKGERPGDLPVMQSSKFEFVINLITAKAFGLNFPPGLLAIADEVIE